MLKRAASIVASGLVFVAGMVGLAAPAHAAGCSYSSCNDQDPEYMGCASDAVTVGVWNGEEFRWSNSCQAFWLRSTGNGFCNYINYDMYNGGYYGPWYYDHSGQIDGYTACGMVSPVAWTKMVPMSTYQGIDVYSGPYDSGIYNTIAVSG